VPEGVIRTAGKGREGRGKLGFEKRAWGGARGETGRHARAREPERSRALARVATRELARGRGVDDSARARLGLRAARFLFRAKEGKHHGHDDELRTQKRANSISRPEEIREWANSLEIRT